MKRWLKYFLLACSILVLLLGSLLALVLWALNTPGGTRALLKVTSILSPVTIEAREISGRLRDELRMQGLEIQFSRLTIRADSFYLRWEAPELWNRKILVRELSLKNVQVQDSRPGVKKISLPGWPSAPFWFTRFQGHLETFLVQNLTYERQNEGPVHIDRLSAGFLWDGEKLGIHDFSLTSPLAKAEGRLDMSFLHPALDLHLQAILGQDYGGFDSLSAEAHLQAGQNREETTGAFLISGRKGAVERLHFGGNLGATPTAVNFSGVRLFQPGRKGLVQAEGKVNFAENPIFELGVNFMDVDLAPEFKMPTDLSGKVELKGPLNDYRGQFLIANRGPGWLEGRASGTLRGNLDRLDTSNLDATWLKGSVQGPLKISWKDGISVQGKLQGRGLNPAVFGPEWKGGINLDLGGQFSRPKIGNPEASFTVGLLESRLADKVLTGNLTGTLKGNLLRIAEMNLHGQGLDLHARGILQERMELNGQADFAQLIPEGRGTLSLAGWLRFREGRLAATLAGRGEDIWLQKVKAGRFDAKLELKDYSPRGQPHIPPHFSLGVKAESLDIGALQAESARFDLSGTLGEHQGQFASRLPNGEIQTVFTGSYKDGKWQGTVQKLTGRDPEAQWNLQEHASVLLSSKQFRMSPLRMQSNHGEKIQVQADLVLNPAVGSLQARWEGIDLARGNFWLKQGRVSGHSSGALNVQPRKGGIRISGGATLQGALTHNSLKVEVPAGSVKLEWDEKGLNASADARVSPEGTIKARLDSPEPFRQDLPQEGRIDLQWKMVDLGLFFPLLPKNLGLKGKGSGSLKGRWFPGRRLEAAGGMKVTQGEIGWQGDPANLSASLDTAALDFIWKDENLQGNVSLASPAQGGLKGDFQLPLSNSLSPSFNRRGSLKFRLSGQLKENGILAKLYPEVIQKSQGKAVLSADGSGSWEKPRFTANLQISDAGIVWRRPMGSPKAAGAPDPPPMEIPSGSVTLDWGEKGMQGSLDLGIKKEGKIHAQISSPEPARFARPTQGKIGITWSGLDLSLLQPFLPQASRAEGQTEGKITGLLLPDGYLDVVGGLKVAEARLGWEGEKGLITVPVNRGALDFQWRKENLQGYASLSIGDYGSLKGSFRLPLPARLSPVLDPAGPIEILLEGQVQEKGLLVALFPGTVQESRGKVDLNLRTDGRWEKPRLKGTLQLTGAGAQLPALGIRVEDVSTRLEIENDQIQVVAFQARSGPGTVEGAATIWLKDWEVQRFQGTLRGQKFQTMYLPDLRIQSSPRLEFQGTPQHLTLRGEVLLPEVEIYRKSSQEVTRTSNDVVLVDQPPPQEPALALDVQVRLILGDRVHVRSGGIDAHMAGDLNLKMAGLKPDKITGQGEIRVTEGSYNGYGLSMKITRGRFIFSGGPADNPALDVLALRTLDDLEKREQIKVGVTIVGNLKAPVVKLYSQPAMADEQVLSYLILGHPLDPTASNLSVLMAGARVLLSGEGGGLPAKIKEQLGLDVMDIQSSGQSTGQSTGQTTAQSTGSGDLSRSMVTIGKYLTPNLYIRYGYSAFSNQQLLTVRYKLSKNWEVETSRGLAMGINLFYKIEFY